MGFGTNSQRVITLTPYTNLRSFNVNLYTKRNADPETPSFIVNEIFRLAERNREAFPTDESFQEVDKLYNEQYKRYVEQHQRFERFIKAESSLSNNGSVEIGEQTFTNEDDLRKGILEKREQKLSIKRMQKALEMFSRAQSSSNGYGRIYKGDFKQLNGVLVDIYTFNDKIGDTITKKVVMEFMDKADGSKFQLESSLSKSMRDFLDLIQGVEVLNKEIVLRLEVQKAKDEDGKYTKIVEIDGVVMYKATLTQDRDVHEKGYHMPFFQYKGYVALRDFEPTGEEDVDGMLEDVQNNPIFKADVLRVAEENVAIDPDKNLEREIQKETEEALGIYRKNGAKLVKLVEDGFTLDDAIRYIKYERIRQKQRAGKSTNKEAIVKSATNDMQDLFSDIVNNKIQPIVRSNTATKFAEQGYTVSYNVFDSGRQMINFTPIEVEGQTQTNEAVNTNTSPTEDEGEDLPF